MTDASSAQALDTSSADHDRDGRVPRWRRRNPLTLVGALILTLVALSATLAPVLAVHDPLEMNPQ